MKNSAVNFTLLGICFLMLALFATYGIINFSQGNQKVSPELSLNSVYDFSTLKSKVTAASCGFTMHGSADESTRCTGTVNCCYGGSVTGYGTSQCGGACTGITGACTDAPTYGQPCTTATNTCGVAATGTYDACGVCSVTTAPSVTSCTYTNACGETFAGKLCGTTCTPTDTTVAADPNKSCVQNFKVTADSVNPGSSVEFSWNIIQKPGVTAKCGFVDLTSATPRPIPGLQNLDATSDRVRITNIQTTTRFCLVCQFYDLSNTLLGDTAAHQWIRVIRIGEN